MRILHVVPGLNEPTNGIAVAARLIAAWQGAGLTEARTVTLAQIANVDEVWVHSMWTPMVMRACRMTLRTGKPLVRMTHANLDPLRLRSKGWKKIPVWWFIERPLMNRSVRVIATCEAETEWNRRAGVAAPMEILDLKACFQLRRAGVSPAQNKEDAFSSDEAGRLVNGGQRPLHVLFLGRASDPLKGVRFLERAVEEIKGDATFLSRENKVDTSLKSGLETASPLELRVVSDHFGAELERDWEWCDVLCLPTLSENFGLVIAEALERGKRVITTDGAPAWAPPEDTQVEKVGGGGEWTARLLYLKGYRDGTDEARVKLLKDALVRIREM